MRLDARPLALKIVQTDVLRPYRDLQEIFTSPPTPDENVLMFDTLKALSFSHLWHVLTVERV